MSNAVTMYEYHAWANQTMLNRLKELPQDVYKQEIVSIFPSVSKAMAHIYTVDNSWLEIASGTEMKEAMKLAEQVTKEAERQSIEGLEAMFTALSERYRAFFRQQADLEKAIVLDNPYAGIRETRLSEIVMQVVNHGTYHRGNISAMLRQMGHASVMTEYALFWYQDQA
ncbi:damage-inducible protein DinB [Paenibacillus sp. A3]|uniref:DinB family protein n=1 Tax=Paenibacillus sp. A3 TaxID=1337054 RepID=UPI0006D57A86|nr:DinB family protein [Paenibacillus sp. A3]KPV60915.1 damage-inducible protein DinB [Paenibacillus sp. A3]